MRPQQNERAQWIGAPERKLFPLLLRQRFRDEQKPPEPVGQTQTGSHPKRQTRVDVAYQSTNGRSKRESHAERDTNHSESAGTFLFWGDVGNVSHRGWDA